MTAMRKILRNALFIVMALFLFRAAGSADFKEEHWENYAEILLPSTGSLPPLGSVMLESWKFQNTGGGQTFSDIRVLTQNRAEVPYQIITRSPGTRAEEVPVRMVNLSRTPEKDTVFTGQIEKPPLTYNVIEIRTGDRGFFRQVSISGSMDGRQWNVIKPNGVIFDYTYSPDDTIRHAKIRINDSTYPHLQIRIMNKQEPPLSITGLSVSYIRTEPGLEENVNAWISRTEQDMRNRKSILTIATSSSFPIRKIDLQTQEKNFRRKVEIFIRAENGEWSKWAEDIIYSFKTDTVEESKLHVLFPETASREIRLIIRNYDSPPLAISGIQAGGHRKTLIFKMETPQRYYIFWGNPTARLPQYDLSELISRHSIDVIPSFQLGPVLKNPEFTDPSKRLPLTERYTRLIYVVVALLIIGLIVWQYAIIKKTA